MLNSRIITQWSAMGLLTSLLLATCLVKVTTDPAPTEQGAAEGGWLIPVMFSFRER